MQITKILKFSLLISVLQIAAGLFFTLTSPALNLSDKDTAIYNLSTAFVIELICFSRMIIGSKSIQFGNFVCIACLLVSSSSLVELLLVGAINVDTLTMNIASSFLSYFAAIILKLLLAQRITRTK